MISRKLGLVLVIATGLSTPALAKGGGQPPRPGDHIARFDPGTLRDKPDRGPRRGDFERLRRKALKHGSPHACPHPSVHSGLCNHSPD